MASIKTCLKQSHIGNTHLAFNLKPIQIIIIFYYDFNLPFSLFSFQYFCFVKMITFYLYQRTGSFSSTVALCLCSNSFTVSLLPPIAANIRAVRPSYAGINFGKMGKLKKAGNQVEQGHCLEKLHNHSRNYAYGIVKW